MAYLQIEVVQELLWLQSNALGDLRLSDAMLTSLRALPGDLFDAGLIFESADLATVENWSNMSITARSLATLLLHGCSSGRYLILRPLLLRGDDFQLHGLTNNQQQFDVWYDRFQRFLRDHTAELVTRAPAETGDAALRQQLTTLQGVLTQVADRIAVLEQREQVLERHLQARPARQRAQPATPQRPPGIPAPQMTRGFELKPFVFGTREGTGHAFPSKMSRAELFDYYADVQVDSFDLMEFRTPPAEVETIWTAIFDGAGITDVEQQKELRLRTLVYVLHNGCSPNLRTRKNITVGGVEIPVVRILSYIAQQAGTLRRFMRGMADEAVAFMERNESFRPHWGDVNMPGEDRLFAFDFADGRTDLSPEGRRRLSQALDRILSSQARSNRRVPFMTDNEGPVRGFVHNQNPGRFPFRRGSSRSNDDYNDNNEYNDYV